MLLTPTIRSCVEMLEDTAPDMVVRFMREYANERMRSRYDYGLALVERAVQQILRDRSTLTRAAVGKVGFLTYPNSD